MRSGLLRHDIIIQAKTETQSSTTGEISETWTTFAAAKASIEPLSVREFVSAQAVQSGVAARIVIRYIDGITAAMRVIHGSDVYNIQGILADKKSGKEYLTLAVSEGVNDG